MFEPFDDTCPKCGSSACSHSWELEAQQPAAHSPQIKLGENWFDVATRLQSSADYLAEACEDLMTWLKQCDDYAKQSPAWKKAKAALAAYKADRA